MVAGIISILRGVGPTVESGGDYDALQFPLLSSKVVGLRGCSGCLGVLAEAPGWAVVGPGWAGRGRHSSPDPPVPFAAL